MKNIAVVPNLQRDFDLNHTKKVVEIIQKFNINVMLVENVTSSIGFQGKYYDEKEIYEKSDLVISLGGDGTLLNIARHTAPHGVPILGINLGHLGFLVELEKSNLEQYFGKLFSGKYSIDNRMMIEASIIRNGKAVENFLALNDVVVTRGSVSRMIHLKVKVDGQVAGVYPADGIIASTPTGSTAYSLSAGGPIVDPNMSLILVTPICPHTLHSRSIIVPEGKEITIHTVESHQQDAMITVDGQSGYTLEPADIVRIRKSKYTTKLVRTGNRSFYEVLRKKLAERGVRNK